MPSACVGMSAGVTGVLAGPASMPSWLTKIRAWPKADMPSWMVANNCHLFLSKKKEISRRPSLLVEYLYDICMRFIRNSVIRSTGLLPLILLCSCASTVQFERMMDGYLDVPIDNLQRHFGYNYIERKLDSGLRVYTWIWKEKGVFPGYESPTTIQTFSSDKGQHVIVIPGTYFPQTPYETSCEFSFIVDASAKTVSWRAHGIGCSRFEGPGTVLGPGGNP